MNKTILHVDMDAFFASVEVLDNPELRGKPVLVGSPPEARGVVAAASYEAREFGIRSAMSSYRALRLCPDAIIIKPRMRRYAGISAQIRDIFLSYTPLVEAISIDEAFLDVTGSTHLFGTGPEIGMAVKKRIRDELHLTASVGIAANKFLAKLASDLEKPDGFVVIEPGDAEAALAELPVRKIWGVGKVTQRELAAINVHKIKDLFTCPREQLESRLGSYTDTLLDLARGIDDREVTTEGEQKSIGAETTFPQDISDREQLENKLCILVERVARELRESGLKARTVNIKVRFSDFATTTRAQTLPSPTLLTRTIRDTALDLLRKRVAEKPLRLLGVSVSNLTDPGEEQLELFSDRDEEKAEALDLTIDELKNRYGPGALRSGREL